MNLEDISDVFVLRGNAVQEYCTLMNKPQPTDVLTIEKEEYGAYLVKIWESLLIENGVTHKDFPATYFRFDPIKPFTSFHESRF